MTDLERRCRDLADMHGGTDLAERIAHAMATQEQQRQALREAAERIAELERALAERGE